MSSAADDFPCAFHIARDGNGLNGLEGRAGVCVFRYDPRTGRYAYTIEYYDGVAGGHAVSVSPDRRVGFLGNTGQHAADGPLEPVAPGPPRRPEARGLGQARTARSGRCRRPPRAGPHRGA